MDEIKFKRGKPPDILGDLEAAEILAELEKIRQEHGGELTANAVIKAATAPDAPLHAVFEWNNRKAGERYRLNQARRLIRSIVIVRDEQSPTPAYLNVQITREERSERFYQHADVIVERPDEFMSAIRYLRRKFIEAEESLAAAKRLGERSARSDVDLQMLVSIGEALATARAIVERIQ